MDQYGYEILFETANFWQSRLEWNEERSHYEIKDVVGPDEYKEHVDNDVFTNYMAYKNMELAIQVYEQLSCENHRVLGTLNNKINAKAIYEKCRDKILKLYLPKEGEDGLIPQDDTYLSLKEIDLLPYKKKEKVGTIIYDYNLDEINEIQVSKQADLVLLLYLYPNLFPLEIKRKNFYYYESKCLHDSSLSLSTHSVMANQLGEKSLAYELFKRACNIDLGPNINSSDLGIHAAAFGGIWQCVVNGFMGIQVIDGILHVRPSIPKQWKQVSAPIFYQGTPLQVTITKDSLYIYKKDNSKREMTIVIKGNSYQVKDTLHVEL